MLSYISDVEPNVGKQISYRFNGTRIERAVDSNFSGDDSTAVTAPDITINNDSKFYVSGSCRGDAFQPKVFMIVTGTAIPNGKISLQSKFSIQTTVSQRVFDDQDLLIICP